MIVIDASVWVSYLVRQDAHHMASRKWLRELLRSKQPHAAPIILLAEVSAALGRRLNDASLARRAHHALQAVPTLHLVNVDAALTIRAANVAADYRLRAADAMYAALAAELGVPLVTWDREQRTRPASLITAVTPAQL